MAIRPVLRMGHPLLNQRASDITEFDTPELDQLIADMLDTMRAEDGAGLAAPQIGVSKRVVVFGFDENPRYRDAPAIPRTVLINPEIRPLDDSIEEGWEGCLSVPGLRGLVPRYTHIEYSGFDASGEPVRVRAEGFHARVVQHECDHLDGILYPQRIRDFTRFGFIDELADAGLLPVVAPDDNDQR
jgi:peptide deformylase